MKKNYIEIINVEYIITNYFNIFKSTDRIYIRDINFIKRYIEKNYNWCYVEFDHDTLDYILYKYSEYIIQQDNYILKKDKNYVFSTYDDTINDIVRKSINTFKRNKIINSIIK